MAGGTIFEFKCSKGHITRKVFPPRTEYDKHSQILCPHCLERGVPHDAYLVFACPEPRGPKKK